MMTRALVVCLLAAALIQPAAAGTDPPRLEQRIDRAHTLETLSLDGLEEALARWVRTHVPFSSSAIRNRTFRPSRATLASLNSATGRARDCSQELALGPDARCLSACDAAKESCDHQCTSARATCRAQCLGIGFACDYQCHAAYFLCKARCSKTRDGCVSNCRTTGGEKES